MKNFKTTGIVVLVFVLLFGYVYFFERGEQVTSEELARQIFSFDAAKVEELVFKAGDEKIVVSRTDEDEWVITSPRKLPAEQEAVQRVVERMADLKAERKLFDAVENLAEYGLDSPGYTLTARLDDGSSRTLHMGAETPVTGGRYAKTAKGEAVYSVGMFIADTLQKSLFDLRDKRIITFDTSELTGVKLIGEVNLAVSKSPEGEWKLTEPYADLANQWEVESVANDFINLRAAEFVNDAPTEEDLREYGLDRPRLAAIFTLGSGAEQSTIEALVGKEAGDGKFYVTTGSRESIFLVEPDSFPPLQLNPFDLVDRYLIRFGSDEVRSLYFKSGQYEARVEVSGNGENREYFVNSKDISADDARNLWFEIRKLKANGRIADKAEKAAFGLEEPELILEITLEEDEDIHLLGTRKDDEIYVMTDGRAGIYSIDPDAWNAVLEELQQLEAKEEEAGADGEKEEK